MAGFSRRRLVASAAAVLVMLSGFLFPTEAAHAGRASTDNAVNQASQWTDSSQGSDAHEASAGSTGKDEADLPEDNPATSLLQAVGGMPAEGYTFSTSHDPPPSQGEGVPENPKQNTVLKSVNITVSTVIVNGSKVIQVVAYKGGDAVAVFNLTSTTEEKEKLLHDIAILADNPAALFDLTWEMLSPTSGTLNLRLESRYNANSNAPSVAFALRFKHVAGRQVVSETVTASIPKEGLMGLKNIQELKDWLAANGHPPILKHGKGFQILSLALMLPKKAKQRDEVKGEEQALQWLQKVAMRKDPIVSVTGELERRAIIEVPYFPSYTWPALLKLTGLVDDSVKNHLPVSSYSTTTPTLKTEVFNVPPEWFRLSPEKQYEAWANGQHPGASGVTPSQIDISGLFGPQYPTGPTPLFFLDSKGQPFGTDKRPDNVSLFGTRLTPVDQLPDYVAGQFIPGIRATLIFPGGSKAIHLLNPGREWHKMEKAYPELRAALAPQEQEKQAALLTVQVNDEPYHLAADVVEKFPTLLHLLAHLATQNPSFVLNQVILTFGASVPRSVKAVFILETPPGVPPWCIFQYDVPITKRNTVVIKSLLKKARRAAEAPEGCNITNAQQLRFETITAAAVLEQLKPELKYSNRQQLNFKGSNAECKRMGAIFAEAYKRGQTVVVFFSATHILKGTVEIPRFGKGGQEGKPAMKSVSSRVHMNEPFPQLVADFQKPFMKSKVPVMEFPYIHVSGGPETSALPHGTIPESWYHQKPGKVKLVWHPQFPLFGDRDTFTDGNGPHPTGAEVNIPIRPGVAGVNGPFTVIQDWLRHHIPNLSLPMSLESMPPEDRNAFFKKVRIEVEGGEKLNLFDILQPLTRTPHWKRLNPSDYDLPYHLLTLPVKNVFVEGDIDFIVTTPDGAQQSHTLPVRPQESWKTVADRFYHTYPQYDREKTKLSLFDSAGNPVTLPDQSPVYVDVKEAVEQHRKGLEISLETPLGKFTTCYRFDAANNKCLVVPMHSLFCGKILGISERAKSWEKQCNAADMRSSSVEDVQSFLEHALRGADLFRPVKLRDLLALIRKHVASVRPDVVRALNLPDPATTQAEISKLKAEIDKLRAKPEKTATDYDTIQAYRHQIKLILSKETKWAAPSALVFFYTREGGAQRELAVPIVDPELRGSDEFWRVYHHATRQSREAAQLDFAHVFNITFRVLGTAEREEVQRRIKHLAKEQKLAQKEASQIKVKVKVSFEVEGSEAFSDTGVEVMLPSDYATGLRIGGKRKVVAQLSKLYGIPKNYFTLDNYPRVVVDPAKSELPILKVALETVCLRPDKTTAVKPTELASVLSERGGYRDEDLLFIVTPTGEKFRVNLKTLRQLQPEKVQKYKFSWKRGLSDISSEAEAKRKERAEAISGENWKWVCLHWSQVGDPLNWKKLLAPWILRLRAFGPLADTPIQLIIRDDKEPNPSLRKSKCQVANFGDLLEYINDLDKLITDCPGLLKVLTTRRPFAFDVGVRSPPPTGFRMWNRAHGDPDRNRRQLERLAAAFEKVYPDTKISWKFAKHKGNMTPDQITSIQALLQTSVPRDFALVRAILEILSVPKEDIAKLTGRLSVLMSHEVCECSSALLSQSDLPVSEIARSCAYFSPSITQSLCLPVLPAAHGATKSNTGKPSIFSQMYIARADGTKLSRMVSARGNPQAPVNMSLPPGEYAMSYSLFSPTKQVNGSPCSMRTAADFENLTWETALGWCGLTFQELAGLTSPFVWLEGAQVSMFPTTQPGIPVVTYQNDLPTGFSFQRPGAPISSILPNDIYFNVVQQPGNNVPGATFIQRAPTPTGGTDTTFKYFGSDPGRWGPSIDPGTASFPRGTTAEFSFYPDPDQEDSNKAFSNPIRKTFKVPGFSHLPDLQPSFNVSFNPNMPTAPGSELVYIQVPAGTGQYYFCPGITLQQFLTIKSKEEVARLCSIPPELLQADFLVSSFGPNATPNFSPAQPSVPLILVDRLQVPHYFTVPWDDNPLKVVEPLLRGGHPKDMVVFSFANANRCTLSYTMLSKLRTWVELARSCSETFEGTRPTSILGVLFSDFLLQLRITMPEELKAHFTRRHQGLSPESVFSFEPLASVVSNLLIGLPPGVTLEVFLELNDGTKINLNTLPEEQKNLPATQIPGLSSITIQDTNVGSLQDLLKQLNLGGQTPYSEFVTKMSVEGNSPSGFRVPTTDVHIGGPTAPGAAKPHLSFEMLQPETVGPTGAPEFFGARFPIAHGSLPETMPMENVIKLLHNPQVAVTTLTGSQVPFTMTTQRLDMSFKDQVGWLKGKLGIDNPSGINVTVVVDGVAYRSSLTCAQLLGHSLASLLQLAGAADLDDSHTVVLIVRHLLIAEHFFALRNLAQNIIVNGRPYQDQPGNPLDISKLLNIQVPGKGMPEKDFKFNMRSPGGASVTQILPTDLLGLLQEVSDLHGYPGMSLVLSFLSTLKQVREIAPGQTLHIDTMVRLQHPDASINAILNTPAASVPAGTYLMAFTGEGAQVRQVTIPITPEARTKTIRKLLLHLNIALQSVRNLRLVANVGDGTVDFGLQGQHFKIPVQVISSADKTTITELFRQMGKQLKSMLQAYRFPNQVVVLRSVFTKRDGGQFTVETPLGTGTEAEKALDELTLWSLIPEEAAQAQIEHVSMTVQIGGSASSSASQSPAGSPPPSSPGRPGEGPSQMSAMQLRSRALKSLSGFHAKTLSKKVVGDTTEEAQAAEPGASSGGHPSRAHAD
ncbi:hypothetical protein Efla_000850 [Eimeria flavescens]